MTPEVGVVIPTRSAGRGVQRAVLSALSQADVDVHVVVAVDGSINLAATEDGEWLAGLTHPSRVLYLGDFGRPGPLRAAAAGLISCEFVAFLDDDDEFMPGKLSLQLRSFEDPRVALVASNATAVHAHGGEHSYGRGGQPRRVVLRDALRSNPFITSSVVTRSSILRRVGGVPVATELRYCDDYVTWLKLLTQGHGINQPEELVRYRVAAEGSLSLHDDHSGQEIRAKAISALEAEASAMGLPMSKRNRGLARRLRGEVRD